MHVHLINLDQSIDRLAEFRRVNAHLTAVTRFPAIDGRALDIGTLAAKGLATPDILTMYPIGAVGLAMSNVALWDKAIQTQTGITIAEDDAIFNRHFERSAKEVMRALPPDWDLILWGWNFDLFMSFEMLPGVSLCLAQFEQDRMRANVRSFQERAISPRPYRLRWAFGTPCYTVSPKGAFALKSKCLPLHPTLIPCPDGIRAPPHAPQYGNVGIDNTMNGAYRDLSAFVCFPPLVVVKNESAQSTIRNARSSRSDRLPEAMSGPDKVPRTDTKDVRALYRRAIELHRDGKPREALDIYDRLVVRNPDAARLNFNRGCALFDACRFADAVVAFDKVLAARPNDFEALNMRGLALEKVQHLEEALASYDRALALHPRSVETLYNRANVLADLRQYDQARAEYEKVLAFAPDFLPALYNRALVLEQMGRLDEARAAYAGVLAIDPSHAGARENHRALSDELSHRAAAAGGTGRDVPTATSRGQLRTNEQTSNRMPPGDG